jgi:hypothetical protein
VTSLELGVDSVLVVAVWTGFLMNLLAIGMIGGPGANKCISASVSLYGQANMHLYLPPCLITGGGGLSYGASGSVLRDMSPDETLSLKVAIFDASILDALSCRANSESAAALRLLRMR